MYLIDRGELLMQMMHKFHYELPDGCNNPLYGDVIKVIEDAPLIEAEPVRHGRWVEIKGMAPPEYHGKHRCSLCYARALERKMHEELSNYCPNCGAKMDKEE